MSTWGQAKVKTIGGFPQKAPAFAEAATRRQADFNTVDFAEEIRFPWFPYPRPTSRPSVISFIISDSSSPFLRASVFLAFHCALVPWRLSGLCISEIQFPWFPQKALILIQ